MALSKEIGKLNIATGQRCASTKQLFQEANKKATEAFNNEALSTEERIMATRLRVISRILESLEDPDAAANVCQLYLQKLHCFPAVQEKFSVQLNGGMKSLFNKAKHQENVMSVIMINFVVFDFTKKLTKMQVNVFHWPSIELSKQTYNPVLHSADILG